ncbi:ankyrin repeat-containing domain protein, partial [Mycena olivaceomarginata]
LLEHSAYVNIQGGLDGSALQQASSLGHEDIVRLLLEYGADVNVQGGRYNAQGEWYWCHSALQQASREGHEDMLDCFLSTTPMSMRKAGGTAAPLLAANNRGHKAVVKLLLEHGADADAGRRLPKSAPGHAYCGHSSGKQPKAPAVKVRFELGFGVGYTQDEAGPTFN